jgi:hypothetical protein
LAGRALEVPINKLVRPGELQLVELPSLYAEPPAIKAAQWVYGDQPDVVVRNAFEFADAERCAVFHVYNGEHPTFKLIDSLAACRS